MSGKRTLEDTGWGHPRPRKVPAVAEPQREMSPQPTQSPSEVTDELSTGVTGQERIQDSPTSPHTIQELQEEIEGLEAVVDQLDAEKHALKMRLNEIDNFQKFNVGDLKKWLISNYDFDRKDTPDLLAGIFENYLMQNDSLEVLPHQLIVKNSARGQARRDKIAIARFNMYQRREKDKIPVPDAKSKKSTRSPSQEGGANDAGTYGQFLYVSPDAIEDLYETKPWSLFLTHWPKLRPTSKSSNFETLVRLQEAFLEKNVVAIWERTHWFPIKMTNGKTPMEVKLLGRHHNRRKRRQAQLKERLESLSVELKSQYDKGLLEQSIFGNRWVSTILQRPNLWIPRENASLLDQLGDLDTAEPERNYHFGS